MDNTKRLFIALDISDSIRNDIDNEVYGSNFYRRKDIGKVSWVKPANLHITLKFLGDTKTGDIIKIGEVMSRATGLRGAGALTLDYTGLGVFPNMKRPRVIWVGFNDSSGTLDSIVTEINIGLEKELGIKREMRRFTPHLTLARIRGDVDHNKLAEFIKDGLKLTESSFEVNSIVLYESELKPSGAVYKKVMEPSLI